MSTTLESSLLDQEIAQAIDANPHLGRRRVKIRTDLGHVVLQGKVNSFFEKQMAQEALRNIEGIERIDNELEVAW